MDYYAFRISAQQEWAESDGMRFGQVYFNLLHTLRPDLSEQLRATPLDPFHRDKVSTETEQFVMDNW